MRKKRVKLRGSKTHGHGAKKKRRGKGSRGGKGRAGTFGQKKILRLRTEPQIIYGKKGFKSLKMRKIEKRLKCINLSELKRFGQEVDITKLGYDKVLGKGSIDTALTVKARSFSKSAIKKIEEKGGKAIKV